MATHPDIGVASAGHRATREIHRSPNNFFGCVLAQPGAAVIGGGDEAMMVCRSRRVTGEEAYRMGLADVLVPQDQVRAAGQKLAAEIAENSPLGVTETRATMRTGLADRVMK